MNETNQEENQVKLPFNNLYLISGLVHGLNKAWMYFLTILFLISGYVLFQAIIAMPLIAILLQNGYTTQDMTDNANVLFDSTALKMDRNLVLLMEMGMFVFAFIGFFIGLKYIHLKSLTSVVTGFQKFRLKRFFFAFGVWGSLLVLTVLYDLLVEPGSLKMNINWTGFIISSLIMIVLMPVQTGIEEVFFRGYLLQGLSQVFKNGYLPLIITSLLFGWAHMSNPEVKEYGRPIMLTYYTFFALFMGSLTLLDEGLELAFGIHFANNIISSILICPQHSVIKTYSIFESTSENPYTEIFVWLVMAIITFTVFWFKYRWNNFKLILK